MGIVLVRSSDRKSVRSSLLYVNSGRRTVCRVLLNAAHQTILSRRTSVVRPKLSRSDFVVRLQWRLISTVQVRVGVCHTSVAEGHCVTARWGGEQPEANPRSVG